jgi:putative transposase
MKHKRAYRYRFFPTKEQAQILARTFGCVRFVYNWGLNLCEETYKTQQRHLYYSDTCAALTTLKQQPGTIWLNEVAGVPLQQALKHLDMAYKSFFKGHADYPTFKKKHGPQSASYVGTAFKLEGTNLTLARMKEPLDIHWSRLLPEKSKPSTATVSKDTAGRYFISILVEEEIKPLEITPQTVGLDLGISSLVILSTGEKVGNPQFFRKEEKNLARAQRRHAKKKKGSKNREKARRKVARLHARIADKRRDYQHKLTTRIIHENQVICVESLAVKNMMQNHHLAKSIVDAGWGEIVRQLEYKAQWYGRALVKIDRFEPSSKKCSCCGYVLDDLDLSVREWTCPNCGALHDRDINAADNIHAAGLVAYGCGGGVRHERAQSQSRNRRRSSKASS